jgi:adenosylcobinamide kinase / adenosylcobinamide-phosphate guanylyltransferase
VASPRSSSSVPHSRGKRLALVLGGARSGKSSYAESLAPRLAHGRPVIYVATAQAGDDEMRARIAQHQASRPATWTTIEAPREPATAIAAGPAAALAGVVLLDCVTLWVSNALLAASPDTPPDTAQDAADEQPNTARAEKRVWSEVDALLGLYRSAPWSLVLVTNEVGMGVVPPYPLGRVYRDLLGQVNARLAAEADAVISLTAGLAVELKTLAAAWEREAAVRLGLDEA